MALVPHKKLAKLASITPEWSSRAEEEDIPRDVSRSPGRERRTEMISAAIERCAGIDVGKKFLGVCVMVGPLQGEPQVEIRKFGTIRSELEALRNWLTEQEVTHVVMESTGSYWKPVGSPRRSTSRRQEPV